MVRHKENSKTQFMNTLLCMALQVIRTHLNIDSTHMGIDIKDDELVSIYIPIPNEHCQHEKLKCDFMVSILNTWKHLGVTNACSCFTSNTKIVYDEQTDSVVLRINLGNYFN